MTNRICAFPKLPSLPTLFNLEVGSTFRYINGGCKENVYMKVADPMQIGFKVVNLRNGKLYSNPGHGEIQILDKVTVRSNGGSCDDVS